METINLYNLAEQEGILVSFLPLNETKGLYLEHEGKEYIALDEGCTLADEKVVLAHELGHCMTGGGYNLMCGSLVRMRLEKRAERWAIERLVPLNELRAAIKQGDEAISSLAEHFGVTEGFMQKVLTHYTQKVSA
ncbi:MAG: ImmA/IrrE family metallo-endopeptidase [Clostridia bacterium]|nr:ImmA/IrrE family metallo-endopeptidase [Clostridia bacterium]